MVVEGGLMSNQDLAMNMEKQGCDRENAT